MATWFNNLLNDLVRNLPYSIRIIISACFFVLAAFTLIWSIRKKNDSNPIAWGWFILCILSMLFSVVYVAL